MCRPRVSTPPARCERTPFPPGIRRRRRFRRYCGPRRTLPSNGKPLSVFVVDTNILVYAAEKNFPEHQRCREQVLAWLRQPGAWFSTWGIFYEFLRVVTHPRVFRRPWNLTEAWRFLEAFLLAPGFDLLVPTSRHQDVAAEVFQELPGLSGNLIHDAHTAVLMKEHGIRQIYTRDTDFHRFPFVEVVDPLA
ncbi:MAG: PIN domain-containing protein [Candidatus Dadabacteria bacterium]|nr:MAG: PIN domain-containing protein [Candidatus Dadabacteria bacterium]